MEKLDVYMVNAILLWMMEPENDRAYRHLDRLIEHACNQV